MFKKITNTFYLCYHSVKYQGKVSCNSISHVKLFYLDIPTNGTNPSCSYFIRTSCPVQIRISSWFCFNDSFFSSGNWQRKWWLQNSLNHGFLQFIPDFRFPFPVSHSARVGAGLRPIKYSSKPERSFYM